MCTFALQVETGIVIAPLVAPAQGKLGERTMKTHGCIQHKMAGLNRRRRFKPTHVAHPPLAHWSHGKGAFFFFFFFFFDGS